MKTKLLLLVTLCASVLSAQKIVVNNTIEVKTDKPLFYPQLNADGTQLLLTTENYQGLYLMDLNNTTVTTIAEEAGAGYDPLFNGNRIYYKTHTFVDGRKYVAMKGYDKATKQRIDMLEPQRGLTQARNFNNGFVLTKNKQLLKVTLERKVGEVPTYVCTEDLQLVLYRNGVRQELNPYPASDGLHYIWASLSPNGKMILFNTHFGTAVCDLNGKLIANLGRLNAPVWYSDQLVVGMYDKDDGYRFTESKIGIVSLDGKVNQILTDGKEMAMYPSVAPAAGKIAYNTISGKVFIISISVHN